MSKIKDSLRLVVLLGNCGLNMNKNCVRKIVLFDENSNYGHDIVFKESDRVDKQDYLSFPPCHVVDETSLNHLKVSPFVIDEDTFLESFSSEISPLNLCLDWNCDDHNMEQEAQLKTLYLEIPDEVFDMFQNQEIGYHLERKSIILQAFRDGKFDFFDEDSFTGDGLLEMIEECGVSVDSEDYFFDVLHDQSTTTTIGDDKTKFTLLDELLSSRTSSEEELEEKNGKLVVHLFNDSYEFGDEDEVMKRHSSNMKMNENNCFAHFVNAHKKYLSSFTSLGLDGGDPVTQLNEMKEECISLLNDILEIHEKFGGERREKNKENENPLPVCDTLCLAHMQLGRMYSKQDEYENAIYHLSFAIENFNPKHRSDVITKTLVDRFLLYYKLQDFTLGLEDVNQVMELGNNNYIPEEYESMIYGYRGIFQYENLKKQMKAIEGVEYETMVQKLKLILEDLKKCLDMDPKKKLKKLCKKYQALVFDMIEIKKK